MPQRIPSPALTCVAVLTGIVLVLASMTAHAEIRGMVSVGTSLEVGYDSIGWAAARTISSAAINSWIGEEIRIVGVELARSLIGAAPRRIERSLALELRRAF